MIWRTSEGELARVLGGEKPAKRNKFGAKKTVVDGITFDSKAEAARYGVLKAMLARGEIRDLERQVAYILAPDVVLDGKRRQPLRYRCDFRYVRVTTGEVVVEDVKGMRTPDYRIKRHLMKSVLGIEVKEVCA